MKVVQQEYAMEIPVIPLFMRADILILPKKMKHIQLTGHQFHSTLHSANWHIAK
jgi:hypothetical protein